MENDYGLIEVYHAGTDIIENPICSYGRKNLDFGHGFYVTDIYDQALNFAKAKGIERQLPPKINSYLLDKKSFLDEANTMVFEKYDNGWLDFIVACRSGKEIWQNYDYVEGGVADDRVIDTVNMYIQGYMSKTRALKKLRYLKPNNQICIINQELLDRYLKFNNCMTIFENGIL